MIGRQKLLATGKDLEGPGEYHPNIKQYFLEVVGEGGWAGTENLEHDRQIQMIM